ncbi:hypothetical protein J7E97_34755 [Streptomyces sp. ISL-66]|uniref:hypothetical protein n=1 Tax=Streptomyces sp. ISL-66 TaxID=2819186 RepID=UPI001BE4E793|nr:hypothetical protein [Streptomyces sp. ISL-66]MBT2472874.1 hypothetical protein [Streptomyces sp. ISL-66]
MRREPAPAAARARNASPLLGEAAAASAAGQAEFPVPAAHTGAELTALIGLLAALEPDPGAAGADGPDAAEPVTVVVGHGRDEASRAAAAAFTEAWRARGGQVLATVDWPESAASWLRPARRMTEQSPRAWVVTGALTGWAQMSRRLRHSTDWDPARTFAFAALRDPRLRELAGPDAVRGLRGATADGGTWEFGEEDDEGFFRYGAGLREIPRGGG